jgi:hypothetical protein
MVISGGQTGVDQGALAAAQKLGIPYSGWAPFGFRCENGRIPSEFADKMRESPSHSYVYRTTKNVLWGDATIIYCYDLKKSPGTRLTTKLCRENKKPWFDMVSETSLFTKNEDGFDHMAKLLECCEIINVAGSRESNFPGIFEASKEQLIEVFSRLL